MTHLAQLFTGSAGSNRPFIHMVDRDGLVQYMIIIMDGSIKVCDLDGTVYTPSSPDGLTYIDVTGAPSEQIRVASIADYTFIVNREKTVGMLTGNSDKSPPGLVGKSTVFIKAANYDTEYSVTLNGTEEKFKTEKIGGREMPCSFTQSGTNVGVVFLNHGLEVGDEIEMKFPTQTTATGVSGKYAITSVATNSFNYTSATSQTIGTEQSCTAIYNPTLSNVTIATKLAEELNTISGFTVTNTCLLYTSDAADE